MLCRGGEAGAGIDNMQRQTESEGDVKQTTHVQNLLEVHGGDEAFALFVELMEALLVPVAQIRGASVLSSVAL